MKILAVSRFIPSPTWGGGLRNYYLLKALASEHSVSLLAPAGDAAGSDSAPTDYLTGSVTSFRVEAAPPKRLHQLTTVLRGRSHTLVGQGVVGLAAELGALLSREHYDAVLFDSVFTADLPRDLIVPADTSIIINQHNIEYELLTRAAEREDAPVRRWYYRREARLLKPVELDRCRRADLVLVVSERERDLLARELPDARIAVVPNGVDIARYQAADPDEEAPGRVVFTGSMDYYPNVQAVLFFAAHCWPRVLADAPDATWQIVGRNPPPAIERLADLPGVSVLGTVPDVRPFLAEAQVAIAPLLTGSGTRLKILEALAMGKAVVSTTIGCEGLALRSGEHLLVADEAAELAGAVSRLLRDADERSALGAAGREIVATDYSWDHSGAELLAAVGQLNERGHAHVAVGDTQVAPHDR